MSWQRPSDPNNLSKCLEKQIFTKEDNKRVLGSFSERLITSAWCTQPETTLIDYFKWHESTIDLDEHAEGELLSVTHNELNLLWSNKKLYRSWEASMYLYATRGYTIRRIFAVDPNASDGEKSALLQVFYRHALLGMTPVVVHCKNLIKNTNKDLGIECDMYGLLNRSIAYFFKFPINSNPILVRSVNDEVVKSTESAYKKLIEKASDVEKYRKAFNLELMPGQIMEAEEDADFIIKNAKLEAGNLN